MFAWAITKYPQTGWDKATEIHFHAYHSGGWVTVLLGGSGGKLSSCFADGDLFCVLTRRKQSGRGAYKAFL